MFQVAYLDGRFIKLQTTNKLFKEVLFVDVKNQVFLVTINADGKKESVHICGECIEKRGGRYESVDGPIPARCDLCIQAKEREIRENNLCYEISLISQDIEKSRLLLNDMGKNIGLMDQDLLRLSQKLDELIVNHMKKKEELKQLKKPAARTADSEA